MFSYFAISSSLPCLFTVSSSLSPYPPSQGQNSGPGPGPGLVSGSSSTPGLGPVTHYYPPQVFQNTNNPINNGGNIINSNNSSSSISGVVTRNSTVGQNTALTMNKNIVQNNNFVGSNMSSNTPLLPVTNSWLQQQPPFPSQSVPSSAIPSGAGSGILAGGGTGMSPHPLTMEGKTPLGSTLISANYMNQSSSPSIRPHGKPLEHLITSAYEQLKHSSHP